MRTAVIFALLALAGCGRKEDAPKADPGAFRPAPAAPSAPAGEVRYPPDSPLLKRIKVAVVESARLPMEEVIAPGKIESNPNRISRVAMPAAGRVQQVMVAVGDAVREGQPLLAIESPDAGTAISNYRQTQARLEETKAAVAKAQADLSRVTDLYAGRAIAQKEVLGAESALAQAKSAFAQAQAARDESSRRLEIFGLKPEDPRPAILVRAPVAGKVLDLAVTAGEYRNDTSAPLMTVADLSTVYMAADVPESQIRLISQGERVRITLSAYPNEMFSGTVSRLADVVDPQTRTIKVRAALANPAGRLRPEMFGEIRHEESFRDVPTVPAGAIIQSDKQSIVYREKSAGVFEPVTIAYGKQKGERVPVLSGIQRGDRIVVDGAMLLKGTM